MLTPATLLFFSVSALGCNSQRVASGAESVRVPQVGDGTEVEVRGLPVHQA